MRRKIRRRGARGPHSPVEKGWMMLLKKDWTYIEMNTTGFLRTLRS